MQNLIEDFKNILTCAIDSVKPVNIFKDAISLIDSKLIIKGDEFDLGQFENIYIIGFGKASSAMATELENILYDYITDGVVITKYGFKTPTRKIKVYEAGHPVPDENTIKYSKQILRIALKAEVNDLVLCLISGGGSSLFEVLPEGLSLDDLKILNDVLLRSGADIFEINLIRKKFSLVKGGKLLKELYPASCISIIISDVIGDDLSTIASGPTFLSSTEENKTKRIETVYNLKEILPERFVKLLKKNNQNIFLDSLKTYYQSKIKNYIVASNQIALEKAKEIATLLGYNTRILNNSMQGEARIIAENFVDEMVRIRKDNKNLLPVCLLMGGETTVTVKGKGIGGRNLEFALACLIKIMKLNLDFEFLISSVATDGNDGMTDAAGAIVNLDLIKRINSLNMNPEEYLSNNDSYTFFNQVDALLRLNSTFTNVMDVVICLMK